MFLVWRRRWSTAESQRPRRDRRFFLKFFWFLLPNSSKNMKFEWKNYAEDSIRHFVFILLWGFSIVKRKSYAISYDYLVHKLVCFDWIFFCFYIISPKNCRKYPNLANFSVSTLDKAMNFLRELGDWFRYIPASKRQGSPKVRFFYIFDMIYLLMRLIHMLSCLFKLY